MRVWGKPSRIIDDGPARMWEVRNEKAHFHMCRRVAGLASNLFFHTKVSYLSGLIWTDINLGQQPFQCLVFTRKG